jgi:hypothetical protein
MFSCSLRYRTACKTRYQPVRYDFSRAGLTPAWFASTFLAHTMGSSDFSGSFITGYGSSPSRCGPLIAVVGPEISRFPTQGMCARAGFSDHAEPVEHLR